MDKNYWFALVDNNDNIIEKETAVPDAERKI